MSRYWIPHLTRSLHSGLASRPIPSPRESVLRPAEFLKAIGRSLETKLSFDSWEALWRTDGHSLKAVGLSVRDRKYVLWCMEKYRSGVEVQAFAHELRPKKTIRGWGPKVQHGRQIRSRRDR